MELNPTVPPPPPFRFLTGWEEQVARSAGKFEGWREGWREGIKEVIELLLFDRFGPFTTESVLSRVRAVNDPQHLKRLVLTLSRASSIDELNLETLLERP
ncbi:MAG: hypothetical protein ACKO6N_16715 [Myxococcota bacterium]